LNRVLVSFLSNVLVRKIIFIIFQGCFTVQLSRFLESFFDSVCCALYRVSEYYLIKYVCTCQHFFLIFFKKLQNVFLAQYLDIFCLMRHKKTNS